MPTVVVNSKFQVVDIQPHPPSPGNGRHFPITDEQYRALHKERATAEHGLNGANGYPRFGWDSKESAPYELEDDNG